MEALISLTYEYPVGSLAQFCSCLVVLGKNKNVTQSDGCFGLFPLVKFALTCIGGLISMTYEHPEWSLAQSNPKAFFGSRQGVLSEWLLKHWWGEHRPDRCVIMGRRRWRFKGWGFGKFGKHQNNTPTNTDLIVLCVWTTFWYVIYKTLHIFLRKACPIG